MRRSTRFKEAAAELDQRTADLRYAHWQLDAILASGDGSMAPWFCRLTSAAGRGSLSVASFVVA